MHFADILRSIAMEEDRQEEFPLAEVSGISFLTDQVEYTRKSPALPTVTHQHR